MGDDQRMLGIDRTLQVVGGLRVSTPHHEADLRLRMMLQLFQRGLQASVVELWRLLTIQFLHAVETLFGSFFVFAFVVNSCLTLVAMASASTLYAVAASLRMPALSVTRNFALKVEAMDVSSRSLGSTKKV